MAVTRRIIYDHTAGYGVEIASFTLNNPLIGASDLRASYSADQPMNFRAALEYFGLEDSSEDVFKPDDDAESFFAALADNLSETTPSTMECAGGTPSYSNLTYRDVSVSII